MAVDHTLARKTSLAAVTSLYLAAMLQGLTLVSFPASSAVLKGMHGFTDAQYGTIFLPQVLCAVLGALAGAALATRSGLKNLLCIALLCNALSQLLLAVTVYVPGSAVLTTVLAATSCLGLGFGLSGAPLNALPALLFPGRRDTALVALHTLLGFGLAIGPLIANPFVMAGHWIGFPMLLCAFALLLSGACALLHFPEATTDSTAEQAAPSNEHHPRRNASFWLFVAIAVLYAFAEGTFGNWAVLYLQDVKHLPVPIAAAALSVFWAAMVGGRLLASVLVLYIRPERIWLTLPLLMIAAFLALPYADTPALGIGLFALAGLACSAFFPLSVGLSTRRFERHVPWVSSMMIAALMTGVGLGSYLVGLLQSLLPLQQLYRLSVFYPLVAMLLGIAVLWNPSGTRAAPALETARSTET